MSSNPEITPAENQCLPVPGTQYLPFLVQVNSDGSTSSIAVPAQPLALRRRVTSRQPRARGGSSHGRGGTSSRGCGGASSRRRGTATPRPHMTMELRALDPLSTLPVTSVEEIIQTKKGGYAAVRRSTRNANKDIGIINHAASRCAPPATAERHVEAITSKRVMDGVTEYKAKWAGVPDDQSTWESEANLSHLSNCAQKIADYNQSKDNSA